MRRRCIGGPRGQKTRQKTRIWLLRVQLSVERRRGRNQASMSSMRTGRIDAAGRRASIWVFLSSQNPPCIRAAAPAPPFAASNWQEEHSATAATASVEHIPGSQA